MDGLWGWWCDLAPDEISFCHHRATSPATRAHTNDNVTTTSSITLSDLHIDCIVGIREREQRTPQPLIIEATMHLPPPPPRPPATPQRVSTIRRSRIGSRL